MKDRLIEFWLIVWLCVVIFRRETGVRADCIPTTGCQALAYYTVQTGQTVDQLISRFQVTSNQLQSYNNNITNLNSILAGTNLYLPFDCTCTNLELIHVFAYPVVSGDTVDLIVSEKYQNLTTSVAVSNSSHLDGSASISPGNTLSIPVRCFCGDPSVSRAYGLFTTYVVRATDNLTGIATAFSVPADYISRFNSDVKVLTWNSIIFIPSRAGNGDFPTFNDTSSGGSSSKSNTAVIVGVVVGVLLLAIFTLAAVIYGRRRLRRKKLAKTRSNQQSALLPSSNLAESKASNLLSDLKSVEFTYEELAEATDDFNLSCKIGQGGFASVYYGVIRNQKLAIKKMNLQATKEFLAELQVLTHVHHTNLVQLIGYCTTNSLFLVYEYIENGTVDHHLRHKHSFDIPPLTWTQRVQISLDAARGLEYIHEHTKPTYIHRDIKSANILIDSNFHAKVADFGLAKLTEDGTGTGIVGTFGYMSPEYALYGEVSPKLDVFAFGVVLFEIISGRVAISGAVPSNFGDSNSKANPEGRTLSALFEPILNDPDGKTLLPKYVDPAIGDDYPLDAVWKMAQLARRCTQQAPELRPTMRFAVVQLMTLASSTQEWDVDYMSRGPITIEPKRFPGEKEAALYGQHAGSTVDPPIGVHFPKFYRGRHSSSSSSSVPSIRTHFKSEGLTTLYQDVSSRPDDSAVPMPGQLVRNKQVKLKQYVLAALKETDLEVVSSDFTLELQEDHEDDVLVKNLFLSCDPYMRILMSGLDISHSPPFKTGQTVEGFGVSKVVLSRNPNFNVGDYVTSWTKWEEYSVIAGGERLRVVDRSVFPLSYHLGALGMPGFTAYAGLFEVLKPKRGETIFVSAASGAVGQIVGQLAKVAGLYVVGSAGSQVKIDLLLSKLGYDAAFNYKEEEDFVAALRKCCPRGIDMYFDNVGGKTLDAVLESMNSFGRIAVSGMISQYDTATNDGLYSLSKIVSKRITMQGFLQSDYTHLMPQFMDLMAGYVKENKVVYFEDFAPGLDYAADAMCRLMKGSKIGKQLITVAKDF